MSKEYQPPEWQKNVALATNVGGVVAAPGALYGAYRAAKNKEGGIPRDAMRFTGKKLRESKRPRLRRAGRRVGRAVDFLGGKGGRAASAAAIATGGIGLGLQSANVAGDAIAARMIGEQKKRDRQKRESVGKALQGTEKSLHEQANDYLRSAGLKSDGQPNAALSREIASRSPTGEPPQPAKPRRAAGAQRHSGVNLGRYTSRRDSNDRRAAVAGAAAAGSAGALLYGKGQMSRMMGAVSDQRHIVGDKGGPVRYAGQLFRNPDKMTRAERDADRALKKPSGSPPDPVRRQGLLSRSADRARHPKSNPARALFHPNMTDKGVVSVKQPKGSAENLSRYKSAKKRGKYALAATAGLAALSAQQSQRNKRNPWT